MSRANYACCEGCDRKAFYVGEEDIPEGVVVWHQACLDRRHDAVRYDERRKVLDAARPLTVLMSRAHGGEVAAVPWSALLEALGLKP